MPCPEATIAPSRPLREPPARAWLAATAAAVAALTIAGCGSAPAPAPDPATVVPATAPFYASAIVRPTGQLQANAVADARALTHQRNAYAALLGALSLRGPGGEVRRGEVDGWLGERAGLFLTHAPARTVGSPIQALGLARSAIGGGLFTHAGARGGVGANGALVLDVTNPQKARRFVRAQTGNAPAAAHAYRGTSYQVTSLGEAYAFVGHFLVLGSPTGVEEAIATASGADQAIVHAPAYGTLHASAPPGALASVFVNLAAQRRHVGRGATGAIGRHGASEGAGAPGSATGASGTSGARAKASGFATSTASESEGGTAEGATAEAGASEGGTSEGGGEGGTAEGGSEGGGVTSASRLAGSPGSPGATLSALVGLAGMPGSAPRSAYVSLVPQAGQIRLDIDELPTGALQAPSTSESEQSQTGEQVFQGLPEGSWVAVGVEDLPATVETLLGLLPQLLGSGSPAARNGRPPTPSQAIAALGGSLGPLATLIVPVQRVVRSLEAHRAKLRSALAGWMGPAGLFVSGSSLLEIDAGVVIASHDPARSRAAVSQLGSLLESGGAKVRKLSVPGAEEALAAVLHGLPVPIEIADANDRLVIGVGVSPAQVALSPPATIGGSSAYRSALAQLGEGLQPRLLLSVPTLLAFANQLGLATNKTFAALVPYLRSISSVAAGGGRLGSGMRTAIVLRLQ